MKNELESLRGTVARLEKQCERLEVNLKEAEDRFQKIFRASSNLMTITTLKEGRMIDLNEASARLGGYRREELIGGLRKNLNLFENPRQGELFNRALREEGRIHNLEVQVRTKRGDMRTILLSADPITVNGEPCLLSVSIDITAREKEADALRKSEEKYRMLVENSLQGVAIIQDMRIVFCNSAFAKMTGYSIQELLSLKFEQILLMLHPDDRSIVHKRYEDRLAGKEVESHYQYRGIKKDGSELAVEAYASLTEFNGKPATQLVYLDITERTQAEEVLRESREYLNLIINCIGDPLFVKDRGHKLVLVNNAFCSFFNRKPEELLGTDVFESMPPELAKSLWKDEEEVFNSEKESITEDDLSVWQGIPRIIMTKKSLLAGKPGNNQLVGVIRDITKYKQLEAQFLQAQKMEAIGVLAGGVAHDFNNLLNVINGYSELIMDELAEDNPLRKDVEQVREAGKRAAALTSQLLAFGRKQILQPEFLNLNTVISQMSSMLRRLIGEDIEFSSIADPTLGLMNADPGQIQQIVMNLAVNARDAMPKGGKLIIETSNVDLDESYVRLHPMVKTGPYVMLAISDNGVGMDEATQAHLFEPFFTTKQIGKGTGLGLSTVYGIVKQSNGFIWVYSEPGKGTTFKIYFPRVAGKLASMESAGKPEAAFRGSETVLVVEDEMAVRSLVSRILRDHGYAVLEAMDGAEALNIVREYAGVIDMVLTDVVMPGLSGTALVSRLKADRPGIRALYVSGYTDNAVVQHGILGTNVTFLQKPFAVESLLRKVREVLNP